MNSSSCVSQGGGDVWGGMIDAMETEDASPSRCYGLLLSVLCSNISMPSSEIHSSTHLIGFAHTHDTIGGRGEEKSEGIEMVISSLPQIILRKNVGRSETKFGEGFLHSGLSPAIRAFKHS